jgi:hypothetical protein
MPGPQTLTDDYFSIDEEKIKQIETVLTIVNGKVVYAKYEFQSFAPLPLKATPAWSPISIFGDIIIQEVIM